VKQIKPENLVFLDEMGTRVGLTREVGRSYGGQRLYDTGGIYRGKNVTSVGAISLNKVLAFEMIDGSMTGEKFKKFLSQKLSPLLWPSAVLVMDNLPAHKVEGVEEIINAVGAKIIYLPTYSPDFNPIEHLWWELKSLVLKFRPQNETILRKLLRLSLLLICEKNLKSYFTHCYYCT
jgi:transposase